ncbi:MAG: MBL fold metallo-hydrolase [Gammaproteobacteria bacterium]|jgi:glyoxylase-like metal-dependent hydrolase (beta-lactamase superfamily II)|nr:MBL fold metallo-hydrolase [Gammaproteobacteria bacterium]
MNKLAVLALFAPLAFAQDAPAPIEHTEVAEGIYMLHAVGGVGLLVGDEYVVMIDDSLPRTGDAIVAKAEELAGRPVDFVINTHVHGDHVGSNQTLAETGAIIVAHENIRKRMKDDPELNTGPGALPVITFPDKVTFHVNGQEARVFHLPAAHTDGDAAILFVEANVIAPGDIVFRGIFPYIDLDNGGSVAGYKDAMQTLIDMANEDTKFISGHGPLATRAGLVEDLAMLVDAEARVKALIDKGMDAEQIVASDPLSIYHDQYNWQFITTERMTRTLIRSLTQT